MPSKEITEDDVHTFLTKLKAADTDKKVDQIQFFGLKLEDTTSLPETTLDAITQSLAPLLKSNSQLLVISTMSHFLTLYIPLIPLSPPRHLQLALVQLLPALLEKMNDPKERVHSAAATCVSILGKRCYEAEVGSTLASSSMSVKGKEKEGLVGMWERCLKEVLAGKGSRGKLEGVKLLAYMRAEEGSKMPLKPWLAPLVELLEDGDGPVREQARESLVLLLSPHSTPPAARSELKKLLAARNVRKTIADPIMNRIFSGPVQPPSTSVEDTPADSANVAESGVGSATPVGEEIAVVHIASPKDLESEFAKMFPYFEGRETEQNWLLREKSVIRVRGMLKGNAHQQYREGFLAGMRAGMWEGLLKTILSLRTTVSQQCCALMQELPEHLGSSFDPFVETALPVLGKMAGLTKKITADKSQRALVAMIIHTTCHPRLLISHLANLIGDKNVQCRHYSASHLKVFLDVQGQRTKSSMESTTGLLDSLDGAMKRGLADVNPAVRELTRAAFWSMYAIWPSRGKVIIEGLEAGARKQLEKANPGQDMVQEIVAAKPVVAKRQTAMSALLAEKRRAAKAAESATANAENIGSPRIVSNPTPSSLSVHQGARAVSSAYATPVKSRMTRTMASPTISTPTSPRGSTSSRTSLGAPSTTPKLGAKSGLSSPASRSRSSSLARTTSRSPPPQTSPSIKSGLRSSQTRDGSTRSSSAATLDSLRTPTLKRRPIPSYATNENIGLGLDSSILPTGTPGAGSSTNIPKEEVVDEALRAQADQAISAAEQLLDFDEPDPSTPARTSLFPARNGTHDHLLRTPINGGGRNGNSWEDSPRNQAVTPLFLEKLKGRRYERSWWARQQQLLDKASPLKQSGAAASSSTQLQSDVEALESGQPGIRNLQKLVLFSSEHPVPTLGPNIDEDDVEDAKRIWEEDKLFERIFEGLMSFLEAEQDESLLEQALVLLWEMVQHQWVLLEDKEASLVDALFRLRACSSQTILESTYSLLSLLTSATDHLILLGIIQSSLNTFLSSHPSPSEKNPINLSESTSTPSSGSDPITQTRTSAYIFALNGIGMCILRLPKPVVLVESPNLETLIMTALTSPVITIRQAANTLILAIQCVLGDSSTTLGLFPQMTVTQRNLATYLMETNGLISHTTHLRNGSNGNGMGGANGNGGGRSSVGNGEDEVERKEKVLGEMDALMLRSMT